MDEATLKAWQALHLRFAKGETLTPEEQAVYEAGAQELDAEENLDGDIEELRRMKQVIASLEAEHTQLAAQKARLDAEIMVLEAKLDPRTRELLGVGN